MFNKIGDFDKPPPGVKDSVPAESVRRTQPVGPDDRQRQRDDERQHSHHSQVPDHGDAPAHEHPRSRLYQADVSLQAVHGYILDQLRALGVEIDADHSTGSVGGASVLADHKAIAGLSGRQQRAVGAYLMAQRTVPARILDKQAENLSDAPLSENNEKDEKRRLLGELNRVRALQAAGYDRVPVAEGQTIVEALDAAYRLLKFRQDSSEG